MGIVASFVDFGENFATFCDGYFFDFFESFVGVAVDESLKN